MRQTATRAIWTFSLKDSSGVEGKMPLWRGIKEGAPAGPDAVPFFRYW